jgi:hypothetical protein
LLNGCETWPLALREVYKAEEVQEQGTEENEEEVTGYMRKLRHEELHNF